MIIYPSEAVSILLLYSLAAVNFFANGNLTMSVGNSGLVRRCGVLIECAYMNQFTESIIILAFILLCSRFIKRRSKFLQKYFIPSSLLAGFIGLAIGPQVLGVISAEITGLWAVLPKYLISVIFAGLFLGKVIPKMNEIWKTAGPQIAFGNTLAWGQYVLGFALTYLILIPFFDANPLSAALIEMSFEGGHGTAVGLSPTLEKLGFAEGTDIALALATISIVAAVISGILILNYQWKKEAKSMSEEEIEKQQKQAIRSGYNLINLGKKISTTPEAVFINVLAFAISIGLGWLMLKGLIFVEEIVLSNFTDIRLFPYMPMFPLAMIGGLVLQLFLRKINKQTFIQRRTAEIIMTLSLDVLIASAIATISLEVVGNHFATILILAVAGIIWILFSFFTLAPRMFPSYWFEKGLTNIGQSMGMTATGLMLNRLVDPSNRSKAKESFAYKQLVFEPFMGGGIVTASALIFIYQFNNLIIFIITAIAFVFWISLGFYLGRKRRRVL